MKQRNFIALLVLFVALSIIATSCAPAPAAPVVTTQIVKETVVVPGEAEVQIKEVVKTVVVEPTKASLGEGGIKVIPFLTNESDPESVAVFQEIFSEFSAENPDTTIDLVIGGHGDIGQRVVAAASVGADLGVITVPPRDMQSFVQAGYLMPLDDVVEAIGADQFKPGALLRGDDGHVYAIGYAGGVQGTLWVRDDLLQEAGVEAPKTYEELLAAAEALTKDTDGDGDIDIYGIGLPVGPDGATGDRFTNFVYENCGDYFDKQGNLVFNKPQVLDAIKRYIELTKYAPPDVTGWSWFDGLDAFLSGKIAMHPYGGRLGVRLETANPEMRANTSVVMLPVGDKTQAVQASYDYLSVFSDTLYPEESKNFLEFFLTGDRLARFELTVPGHLIPPTSELSQTILDSDNEYVQKYKSDVETLFGVADHGSTPVVFMGAVDTDTCEFNPTYNPMPWSSEIFGRTPTITAEMLQRIVVNGEDPEAAWTWAYTEMERIANEWKAANPDWQPMDQ
jgi:ABC-type glycerol-3-phosphate transport system substrate-binding protein